MINRQPRDFRAQLEHWRQISFILFDLGAMNVLAGLGVTFLYSNALLLLGFTGRSLWVGLFFIAGGLLAWKVRRLPAIVPLLIIIGDLWNTIKILPLYERTGYVVLVQSSFVLPLIFILVSMLRQRLQRIGSGAAPAPIAPASAAIRSGKEALALLTSMLVSVGMGLTVLLLFSKFAVNQLAEAVNPLINMFHDVLLVPMLLLCFPLGAALGELIWLQASRFFLSGYELADFIRYLKQIPLVSRAVERMLKRDAGPSPGGAPNSVDVQREVFVIKPARLHNKRRRLLWLAPLMLVVPAVTLLILFGLPEGLDFSRRAEAIEETPAAPGMLVVSQSGRGQYKTITAALSAAEPGQTILVRAGVYHENLSINKPVTLTGDEKAQGHITLECSNDICLKMTADATVRNLRINARVGFWSRLIGSAEATGIGIFSGRPVIENCDISSNTGAGIVVTGSGAQPEIKKVGVHDCLLNGLWFTDQSQGLVSDSDFSNTGWAGIRSDRGSKPVVRRSRIHHSRMDGVFLTDQGLGTFEDCDFFENDHAGIHLKEASSLTLVRGRVFNQKQDGIFIHDRNSRGVVEECEVFGNAYSGIEISEQGDVQGVKSKFHHGQTAGIRVWRNSTATIDESLIFENGSVGLLVSDAGKPIIRKSVFRANAYASIEVASAGDPQIENCQIYGGRGGGIVFHDGAKGRVEDCSIFGHMNANVVIASGSNPQISNSRFSGSGQAGLLVENGGLGIIENCRISNNYVGVEIKSAGAPAIQHCQINGNRSQGLTAESLSSGSITGSDLTRNSAGPWKIENGSRLTRDQNVE